MRPSTAGSSFAPSGVLGFDVTAIGRFTLAIPNPAVPPRMTILNVPQGVTRAQLRGLAVNGEPLGNFYNGVSWALTLSTAQPREFITGSKFSGAATTIFDSGMRWGVMGSLDRPEPIDLDLTQGQVLGLVILASTPLNNSPLTIYTRAKGVVYRQ